eukprot:136242_1
MVMMANNGNYYNGYVNCGWKQLSLMKWLRNSKCIMVHSLFLVKLHIVEEDILVVVHVGGPYTGADGSYNCGDDRGSYGATGHGGSYRGYSGRYEVLCTGHGSLGRSLYGYGGVYMVNEYVVNEVLNMIFIINVFTAL